MTLEFICFHKNWVDIAHFKDVKNWNKYGPDLYKIGKNFILYQTDFYDQCFETMILSGPGVGIV